MDRIPVPVHIPILVLVLIKGTGNGNGYPLDKQKGRNWDVAIFGVLWVWVLPSQRIMIRWVWG